MEEDMKVAANAAADSGEAEKKAAMAARMAHARRQRKLTPKQAEAADARDRRAAGKPSDVVDERQLAQQSFASEQAKQLKELHHWITFHKMGESDQIQHVFIGAAGVAYNIRKGERVPLPQSAINALKLAVRVGLDHGHPVDINGVKYLRKIQESDYSYTIDGTCTPEEAAEWRAGQKRIHGKHPDLVPQGPEITDDLVQVGTV